MGDGKVKDSRTNLITREEMYRYVGSRTAFRGALVRNSVLQEIADAVAEIVDWSTVVYDTDAFWSSGAVTRLTIPVGSGITKVRLSTIVRWLSNIQTGPVRVQILKKGVTFDGGGYEQHEAKITTGGFEPTNDISTAVVDVVEGDWFEVEIFYDTAESTRNVNSVTTWFSIEVIESRG